MKFYGKMDQLTRNKEVGSRKSAVTGRKSAIRGRKTKNQGSHARVCAPGFAKKMGVVV